MGDALASLAEELEGRGGAWEVREDVGDGHLGGRGARGAAAGPPGGGRAPKGSIALHVRYGVRLGEGVGRKGARVIEALGQAEEADDVAFLDRYHWPRTAFRADG